MPYLLLLGILAPLMPALSGCRHAAGDANAETTVDLRGNPIAKRIGQITWIDDDGKRAIVWLDQSVFVGERDRLETRDAALRPQARLRVTKERDGRAIGVVIEDGKIEPGQEVVIAGKKSGNDDVVAQPVVDERPE